MKSRILKLLDYLFLLRPTLLMAGWTLYILGDIPTRNPKPFTLLLPDVHFFRYLLAFTLLLGIMSIYNQLSDLGTDRANHRRFLISEGKVSEKSAWIISSVFLIVFVALTYSNRQFFIVGLVELLVWGILYNFKPFRWSGRPILGFIANLIGGWLSVWLGWAAAHPAYDMSVLFIAIPYLLGTGAIYLLTTVPDTSGDAETAKKTVSVVFGGNVTRWLAAFVIVSALICAWFVNDWKMVVTAAVSLPFFIYASIRQTESETLRAIRYGVLFMSIAVMIYHPWFLVLLAMTFYLSRWYYINRFDLNYPTLKVKE